MLGPAGDRQQLRLQVRLTLSVSRDLPQPKRVWTLNALIARLRISATTNLGLCNVVLRRVKEFMNIKHSQRSKWRQYQNLSERENISVFQSEQTAAIAPIAAAMSSKSFLVLAHRKSIATSAQGNVFSSCDMSDKMKFKAHWALVPSLNQSHGCIDYLQCPSSTC